jgi:glycosyltransferase involved in cell wall biosynthesis
MRVLMTIDAVGGVWRYGLDLARELGAADIACLLAGCGPEPDAAQRQECRSLRNVKLEWTGLPLDWMVAEAAALHEVADMLAMMARNWGAHLAHLNLPSQAVGFPAGVPVAVTSHSCLATWWHAVKGGDPPPDWRWHQAMTAQGMRRADAIMVPTASHADAVVAAYGRLDHLRVVANATTSFESNRAKEPFVFAAGRWWDAGKNVATADAVAALSHWPVRLAGALTDPNGSQISPHHALALGPLTPSATQAEMSRAAIFFSPALYEPFGLAVLEAAACGCALVLSDIPSFRELWTNAALFVAPHDSNGFAAAINRLAEAPSERRALGQRAAMRAREFTLARQAEQVQQVYAAALRAKVLAA